MAQAGTTAGAGNAEIGQIGGVSVHRIPLTGPNGLRAVVITYGARLAELWLPDRNGTLADVVLGHDRLEDWVESSAYFGATCGRYANRIAGGRFVLDGQTYQLDRNEGINHLHGGAEGLDRRVWTIATQSTDAVTLTTVSEAREMGYPGRLEAEVEYRFDDEGRFHITLTARSDAPTVVNLVNHAYFNLAGQGTVLGQELRLFAAQYTPVGEGLIPTGELRAVAGTAMDFTRMRAIGSPLPSEQGFDHNFCLSEPLQPMWGAILRPCAEARDPASGRGFRLWTDQPGVQFYTGAYLDARLPPGKGGVPLQPYAGFALETQVFPDSPNKPQFPPATLRPGAEYRHQMVFDPSPSD